MLKIYKFVFYIVCILLTVPINCLHLLLRQQVDSANIVTTTEDDHYMTAPPGTGTDLPQSKIDDALNLDLGRYTTVSFHYESHQWMHSTKLDQCYDDFTKCVTSLVAPMPVCVMFRPEQIRTKNTYCHAYLDNCRVGYRFWRIIGYGSCSVDWYGHPYLHDYYN